MHSTESPFSICFLITYLQSVSGLLTELQRIQYCQDLKCDESIDQKVCGVKKQNGKNTYKLFDNECVLLKYGCLVDEGSAYGIINLKYCAENNLKGNIKKDCPTNCPSELKQPVCAIRTDGEGFRIKIFKNECHLSKYNCEQLLQFNVTDFFLCDRGTNIPPIRRLQSNDEVNTGSTKETTDEAIDKEETESKNIQANNIESSTQNINKLKSSVKANNSEISILETGTTKTDNIKIYTIETEKTRTPKDVTIGPQARNKTIYKNIVVVGGSMTDMLHINRSAEDFFAATHVLDLPIHEREMTERTRRMVIKIFGPVKVFTPWIKIPKVINEDYYHRPTLSSCYHKCPTKCPDTYAPVCGVPGIVAREPSLMFQNHCFMDVAQCKMFWEDKSWTAESSAYIESSFLFCLGNELNGLYRFLPLIRTLQHMGRLKKKGRFHMKLNNLRFFNNLLNKEPNLMGR